MRHSGPVDDGRPPVFSALGPLVVCRAGGPLALGSVKQRAVLGVLLSAAPHAVPVSRLVEELWPERPPGDPLRSLQVYVSGLRRVLGEGLLVTSHRAYRIDVPPHGYDVTEVDDAAVACETLLAAGDHEAVVRRTGEALDRWRGEAWEDLRMVPSLAAEAVRLDGLRLDLAARRGEALLALGRHRALVPDLEELLAHHPLREDLTGQLMLALHRSGRQADALAVYTAARDHKIEQTGLDPGAELRRLHASVLADDPGLAVEDAAVRARRHLPAQATPLVGRRQEVAELTALLSGEGRLVTVCGPGGVGKTRVALQVAQDMAAVQPDGVWFVGLAELSDPALVPQAVAEALGVDESPDGFLEPLRSHLASRRLLLVLDNVEQLLGTAPFVTQLIEAGPGVRVLVTSREPLRVYGEHRRTLDSLDVSDAVPLFRDRARAADHTFDTSREESVRRVCEALDRLPLAIELVAARAGELSLEAMLGQLESRLDLAVDGPRDRTVRQQTLRGAIGWSVALLTPEDAAAFGRLGVFVGGCDLAAAEAVEVTADQLTRLTRASLLQADDGRFTMLETIRSAAEELLVEVGDGPVRDQHASYFLDLGAKAAAGLRGPDATRWIGRLTAERGNLRAALAWLEARAADDKPAGSRLMQLAADLSMFWYRTSPSSEDVRWLERALAAGPGTTPLQRGRAWHGLAICRGEQGLAEEARAASATATELLRSAGDEAWLARSLNTLGGLTRDLGRVVEAGPILDESVVLRRRLDDPMLPLGTALGNRAMLALDVGDLAAARSALAECLALVQGEDDPQTPLAQALMADVAIEGGDLAAAEELLREAIPALRRHGMDYRLVECLDTCAALAVRRGRVADAAVLVAAADRALAEEGSILVPADELFRERRIGRAVDGLPSGERCRAEAAGAALDLAAALEWATERLL